MSATVSWPLETNQVGRSVLRAPRRNDCGRDRADSRPAPASRAGAPSEHGALRLTRRGRLVLGLVAAALALGGVVATGSAQAGAPHRGVEVTRHVVEPGDTLWALADAVASPREDLRDVVAEIEKLNDLDGAALRAGEMLLLPVARG